MIKGKLKNNNVCENKTNTSLINEIDDTCEEDKIVKDKQKIFQKFTVRDIVFLAIVAAVMILTCAVMPLVAELTKVIFGIAQLVTALQMSLFISVGLMKVRKFFSVTLMLIFMGAIMVAMSPVMGLSNIFVALVVELIILAIFRGYKKDIACFLAAALVPPLGLIVPVVWNSITTPEVFQKTVSNGWVVAGMILAIVAVSLLGAFLGVKISKELEKAGVLKKFDKKTDNN
ncbi:MAG TPA: MptD family putative ECF transporter S component [Clostridia bacterium]|nr:MptD family putative ECF transporter S component [Clostridia bacterium]